MKANELRIGNLIMYTNEKDLNRALRGTVLCVDIDTLMYVENNSRADFYEPIPITPEILEKCGFWYKPGGISGADMWQGMGFWYRVKELPNQEFLLRGDFSRKKPIALKLVGWFNSNIEYIHQLQNLYFSMTGEELEVKL